MPKSTQEEDKKRKEEIETRNEADSLAFRAQKALNEYKDKLPKDVVDEVQGKIDALKKALEQNNPAEIKAASDELNTSMQKIGEAMQRAGAGGAEGHAQTPPPGGPQGKKGGKDDIEEAEVEILDDEKK